MDPNRVKTSIGSISKTYGKILDDSAKVLIPSVIEGIDTSKEEYDKAKRNQARLGKHPNPWGIIIYDSQPLRFKSVNVPNSVHLQVDIYCEIRWAEDDIPVQQDIKVRVWCLHQDTIFREDFDSSRILSEFEDETRPYSPRPHKKSRVVSRFHFDKANPNQIGPQYHIQLGGISHAYEICWHPEKVNVPRIEYQPMDLFLTCQMIAANFFHNEYLEIRKKSEWIAQVKWCQNIFLREHYCQCLRALDKPQTSLLDVLWGI